MLAGAGGNERIRKPHVGQRRAASLAYQVERLDIRAQTKSFGEIACKAGTEISGTGADHNGIDVGGSNAGVTHRSGSRISRERWRMRREPTLQRVRINCEYFRQRVKRKVARRNSVVTQQDGLGNRMRATVEARKPLGLSEGDLAFRFGISPRRCCSADAREEHLAPRSLNRCAAGRTNICMFLVEAARFLSV